MNVEVKSVERRDIISTTLFGCILICLALQAWLARVMEINWDEFFFLSYVYNYERGDLTTALQSFYIYIFPWLTHVPGNEIDQVVAGRMFMLLCEAGTCALIYLLARRFVSRIPALLAVLAFVSAAFTILHGASFRADPLAAFLTMGSLVVLARARLGLAAALVAGLLLALAAMVTVKVVLYAPAFLGIAAWRILRSDDRKAAVLWIGGMGLAAIAGVALLYLIQLGLVPKATNSGSRAGLGNAAETQVSAGFFPRLREMRHFALLSWLQTILLAVGLVAAVLMAKRREDRAEAFAIVGCGATLLCLVIYRNAFPYFFPFILAPAAVLVACAVERIAILSRHALLLVVGLAVPAVAVAWVWSSHDLTNQRQVVSAVHRIFPRPVAYIDRNSMIASFPKRGFFMSTWGMENYRRKGFPVFDDVLAQDTVPLVVSNGPALDATFGELEGLPMAYSLLGRDKMTLRENFIPHWGPLWVAGKTFETGPDGLRFQIAVPGTYTLEGGGASIDGRDIPAGGTVTLPRGSHVARTASATALTLRWGDHLYRPPEPPSPGPVFRGF